MGVKAKGANTLFSEREIRPKQQLLSAFFRKKSEELQEKLGDSFSTLYPQEKIAEKLNITVDQLRQKLYRKKPLTRDWLIAICAAYGLDDCDTSEALCICNLPTLDDISPREEFIVNYLRTHRWQSVGVFEFNQALEAAGLPPLEISYRKNNKKAKAKNPISSKYTEIPPRFVRTYENQGDPYDSLSTQYLPNMLCVAATFLEDTNHKLYRLEAYSNGLYEVREENNPIPTLIKQLDPTNEFFSFFSELSSLVRKEKQRLDNILNDTKNYRNRFSANIKNDCLHIFYEEFNYLMPERNEYYLMEYFDGHYQLSIAHQSMFMQEYLSRDEYYEHYHTYDMVPRKTFLSLEDIDKYYNEIGKSYFYPKLREYRIRAFSRMTRIINEKLDAILRREIFIQNLYYICDDPLDVLKLYNATELFHCKYDSEYDHIISYDKSIQYGNSCGSYTEITLDDLKLAFELGINSLEDISRIKTTKGSVAALLK